MKSCPKEDMVKVRWTCPKCGKKHKWQWAELDCGRGKLEMQCDRKRCQALTKFYMAIDMRGRFAPVREIT